MTTFSILHLSDTQFGNEHCHLASASRTSPCYVTGIDEQIVSALERQGKAAPQVIVVSGDIAETGEGPQYDAARDFFVGLHRGLHRLGPGSEPAWVVVPGNHDVTRAASAASPPSASDADRRDAMLKEFRTFVKRLSEDLSPAKLTAPDLTTPDEPVHIRHSDLAMIVVPLDSCEREGHKGDQHFGFVSARQLDGVERVLRPLVQPWTLQVAVLHHNVVINGPTLEAWRLRFQDVLAKHVPTDSSPEATRKRQEFLNDLVAIAVNRLEKAQDVMTKLARMGFQLVLYGHQHYFGPIHLQVPVPDHDPFGHEGLTLFGAGSIGIAEPGDQPSVPSFHYHEVDNEDFGWRFASTRFRLRIEGKMTPIIEVQAEAPPLKWHCNSARPRKILAGVCGLTRTQVPRMLSKAPEAAATGEGLVPRFTRIDECLRWGRSFGVGGGLGWIPDRIEWATQLEAPARRWLEGEMAEPMLAGLADVLGRQKVYADLPHWGLLRAEEIREERVRLTVFQTSYLPYVVFNARLMTPECAEIRRTAMARLERSREDWSVLNAFLEWAAQRISTRLTFQVLVEVRTQAGGPYVLLRRRSEGVSHFGRMFQFTVGGGFKCQLGQSMNAPLVSPSPLERAIADETELETGFKMSGQQFLIVCLAIGSDEYSPTLTAVTAVDEDQLRLRRSRWLLGDGRSDKDQIAGDLVDRVGWVPEAAPRDWWEGMYLAKVRLGSSLVSSDGAQRRKAWHALANVWEETERKAPGTMDIPPGAAIAAVLGRD